MFQHFKRDVRSELVYDSIIERELPKSMGSKVYHIIGSYQYKLDGGIYHADVSAGDFVSLHKLDVYNRSLFAKSGE